MVTIVDYVQRESADGKSFFSLILQGGMELVLSENTGRYYATAKRTSITSTFDEKTCKGLIGTTLAGKISKVQSEPYDYVVKETGEVLKLSHRWVFNPNKANSLEEVIFDQEPIKSDLAF